MWWMLGCQLGAPPSVTVDTAGVATSMPPPSVDLADRCEEAPELGPGHYRVDLTALGNDMGVPCGEVDCAGGPDGHFVVEVPFRHVLQVRAAVDGDDAVVSVWGACPPEGTCLQAGDEGAWFNDEPMARRVVVAVDTEGGPSCDDPSLAGEANVRVQVEAFLEPPLITCGAPFVPAEWGNFWARAPVGTSVLDPGPSGCVGRAVPGPELLIPVSVPPGATLTANVNAVGIDPVFYLVADCADATTCVGASDRLGEEREVISYTNTNATTEDLYLVVDTAADILPPLFISMAF